MKKIFWVLLILLFIGCSDNRQPFDSYKDYIVISKREYGSLQYWTYETIIIKDSNIKTVVTFPYYYHRYQLGDTIK